jgi:heme/copper-type cytochrome/quinol oxidase subunit 4
MRHNFLKFSKKNIDKILKKDIILANKEHRMKKFFVLFVLSVVLPTIGFAW